MQAKICDGCKAIFERDLPKSEPIEFCQGYAKLTIMIDPVAELCLSCAKKAQYQIAKEAFESLKVKRIRKPQSKAKEPDRMINGEPGAKKEE